jgi:hypothetical protein
LNTDDVRDVTRGESLVDVGVIVDRQPDLLHIVRARHPPGSLASRLNRRKQQTDHHTDNRDHNQKLDKRETTPTTLSAAPYRTACRHTCDPLKTVEKRK